MLLTSLKFGKIAYFPHGPQVSKELAHTTGGRCAGEGRRRVYETKGIRSQKALRGDGSRLIEVGCAMRQGPKYTTLDL